AGELESALENLRQRLSAGILRRPLIRRKYRMRVYAAAALCFVLPFALWFFLRGWSTARVGAPVQVTSDSGLTTDPALSPDGRLLAYASDRGGANLNIWLQRMPKGSPMCLTVDDADHSEPSISPDGSVVVFRAEHDGGGIYAVAIDGGREKL